MKNLKNKLVYKINDTNCFNFLSEYPLVMQLMLHSKGKNILYAYLNFLKLKDINESKLGGFSEVVSSDSFGTKTFYKYNWNNCTGWAEVFQFVYTKNLKK